MSTPAVRLSFEFFPPKTEAMEQSLLRAAKALALFSPRFVSVTYGAGGTTRDRTHKIVKQLQTDFQLDTAAHLTCVGAPRRDIDQIAQHYWQQGVKHIVALRGDPPDMAHAYTPHPNGYAFASDLVEGLRRIASFQISVAAYPETHPEAKSAESDLDNLKRKMQAGATQAITQFFLDTDVYLRFRDRAVTAGIDFPIIPGLLPISNFVKAAEFASKCGASIPTHVAKQFDGLTAGTPEHEKAALTFARSQLDTLMKNGVSDFHFYTLNRADLVSPLCQMLMPEARSAHG